MKSIHLNTLSLLSVGLMLLTGQAKGAITMEVSDPVTYAQYGFTGGTYIGNYDLIGIYQLNVLSGGIPNPFYGICLSPQGTLDAAPHTYDQLTFAQANPGIHPSAWAYGTVNGQQQFWGIQNASYLWNQFGNNIVGHPVNPTAQGSGLALAVYNALYNSTGYGAILGNNWTAPNNMGNAANPADPAYWYAFYTSAVNGHAAEVTAGLSSGYILQTQDYNVDGQQETFLLPTPVPEPTTVLTGLVLLVPVGITGWRSIRKA